MKKFILSFALICSGLLQAMDTQTPSLQITKFGKIQTATKEDEKIVLAAQKNAGLSGLFSGFSFYPKKITAGKTKLISFSSTPEHKSVKKIPVSFLPNFDPIRKDEQEKELLIKWGKKTKTPLYILKLKCNSTILNNALEPSKALESSKKNNYRPLIYSFIGLSLVGGTLVYFNPGSIFNGFKSVVGNLWSKTFAN